MLVDGDDELVGRQVFRLLDYFYQQNDNWIVYTNFFSSEYTWGKSLHPDGKFEEKEKRTIGHYIGPVRTFKVALFRQIKDEDHKDKNGKYLDTLYDDAMQYPLMEMAGLKHIKYVPEICYYYTTRYKGNDDSTKTKIKHREEVVS